MKQFSKPTVGQTIRDYYSTNRDEIELGDIRQHQFDRYIKKLEELQEQGIKKYNGNFFIEICPKKERLFPQILPRLIGHARATCPTPFLDQDVYMYNKKDDILELLWTLPSIQDCKRLKINSLTLDDFDRSVFKFVLDYEYGILYRLMKILNNEKPDTTELIKG